jgi:beta-hydroxylase
MRAFNRWFGRHVVAAASSPNEPGDRVGLVNRLFFLSSVAGQYRRRFKAWNLKAYRTAKVALVFALLVLVVPGPAMRIAQWGLSAGALAAQALHRTAP